METERRLLFRQGALFLLLSALLGLVVAVPAPHPAKWMAAHITGLLTGILIISLGGLWPEVRLEPRRRTLALRMGLIGSWGGFAVNIYAALVNFPGAATEPGRAPDAAWQAIIFFVGLAVVVPTTIGAFYLVWKGLRG